MIKYCIRLLKDKNRYCFNIGLTYTFALLIITSSFGQTSINLRKEYSETLVMLSDALISRQINDKTDPNFGAIKCAHCDVLHTRAAEAVYPFAVVYKITSNKKYLDASISVASWLMRQQEKDGSWKETPEEWTGTSTDQLLMLTLAFPIIAERLSNDEKRLWKSSMEKAGDYLVNVMSPEFASINYVATTTATLVSINQIIPKEIYLSKAKALAHRVVSKMDEDYFINGEGGKAYQNKLGVDLGYNLEMSLWGLGYYARLTHDQLVNEAVKKSLKNHIYFIYPDGSMDGSWGIRSNKWTTYGGATSDGCQVLFSMFGSEDQRYSNASFKNLQFIRTCMKDGIVGYGPHHWEIFNTPPCIYPTFAKAKNLAFAFELEKSKSSAVKKIPTEETGWMKIFKTLDIALVRTKNFMSTVTAYGYEDYKAKSNSKYMHRPTGGAISNLWVEGHGFLQASSVTEYSRPEPMHFPEAPGIKSLTPRIEYTDSNGYFTNLYEFDGRMESKELGKGKFMVSTVGELKDKNWLFGGVGYKTEYMFKDYSVEKTIFLTYHDAWPKIKIIEPIINYQGMQFELINSKTVKIIANKKIFEFKLIEGDAKLVIGENADKFWAPYPALKAYPIELVVNEPTNLFKQKIVFTISIINN